MTGRTHVKPEANPPCSGRPWVKWHHSVSGNALHPLNKLAVVIAPLQEQKHVGFGNSLSLPRNLGLIIVMIIINTRFQSQD